MSDLAAIVASVICEGLRQSARKFHGRQVVFVDDERELTSSIREAVRKVALAADPYSVLYSDTKPAVRAVVQQTLTGLQQ